MPSSHTYQINEIMELVIRTDPKKILDIGVGFGKYGLLCRERLDLWYNEKDDYDFRKIQIDGIEVYDKYLTPVHEYIYNHIYIGNAVDILPRINDKSYDLVLMIDVFEHFDIYDGLLILKELKRISKNVIISVPKILGNQGTVFGNEFETHRTQWSNMTFDNLGENFFVKNRFSILCYAGEKAVEIKKNYSYEVE